MKNPTLLKQTLTLYFTGLTVLFSPFATQALTVEEVINPRQDNGGWVADMADVLSDRTEAKLNNLISNLEQNNGTEIAIVTVPKTSPADSPKTFSTELFNYWEIGKAESNNGILFLVSLGDKRVEIETGYGIESILSDTEVTKIIDTKITPQYKHGNFDRGTLDGTKALISTLKSSANNQEDSEFISTSLPNIQTSNFIVIFIIILFLLWVIDSVNNLNSESNTSNKKRKKRNYNGSSHDTGCNSNSSNDGGSFSSYSSSDSGDFGGGSSDGGGGGGDF